MQKKMSTFASGGSSETLKGEAMYSVAVGVRRPRFPVYVKPFPINMLENVPTQLWIKKARNH